MKKQLLSLIIGLTLSTSAGAQVNPHAIGVRGAVGHYGYVGRGGEVSYQHGLSESNRLEFDLGATGGLHKGYSFVHGSLTGVFHWVWNIAGGFNWYAGPGAQIGFYSQNGPSGYAGLSVAAGGQIGIEYDFNDLGAPIQVSADARPMFGFLSNTGGFGLGSALSVRYTF